MEDQPFGALTRCLCELKKGVAAGPAPVAVTFANCASVPGRSTEGKVVT